MLVCHLCFAFLVSLAASTAIRAHLLSVRRCGLTSPLTAFLFFSTSTTYHHTRNRQCERFNQTISRTIQLLDGRGLHEDDGRRCSLRLFTPSDHSSACLLMKRPTRDCFIFLGDPLMVWRYLHGC